MERLRREVMGLDVVASVKLMSNVWGYGKSVIIDPRWYKTRTVETDI